MKLTFKSQVQLFLNPNPHKYINSEKADFWLNGSNILRFIWPQPFEATLGQKNNRTIQKRTGSTVVDFRWVIARVVKCFHIFLTPVLQQLL